MNYEQMKKENIKGWNTYYNDSILTHVYMPYGLGISLGFKDYTDGKHLNEVLIGRFEENSEIVHPSFHAYDGSYTECFVTYKKNKYHIQTATKDDNLLMLVKSTINAVRTPLLTVDVNVLWNKPGVVDIKNNIINADLHEKSFNVYHTGKEVFEPFVKCKGKYYAIEINGDIGISTNINLSLNEIEEIIKQKRNEFLLYCEKFSSKNSNKSNTDAEIFKAMQSCLAWDTIYDPLNNRIISPVSRLWSQGAGGYTLFCWDTYFASLMASVDNKYLAYSNAIEITREKTEKGFVPNFAHATGFKSRDRSQPPVGSYCINQIYKKYKEKWFLEEVFDDLYTWNLWWRENRQIKKGLFTWGSNMYTPVVGNFWEEHCLNNTQGAALESGLDNSPMYDDITFDDKKSIINLIDVGLSSLVLLDTYSLAEIAIELGEEDKANDLNNFAKIIEESLLSLWEDKYGFFLNYNTDKNEFSYRISPTNFYALYSKKIPSDYIKRIVNEHFYNSNEFFGEYIMPSIARNDKAFKDNTYWRGRIWAPMNFLAYIGLKNHPESEKAAFDLAEKSKNLILKEWLEFGHIHENYNSETGEGCDVGNSDKFYHWGGLLSYIYIIETFGNELNI